MDTRHPIVCWTTDLVREALVEAAWLCVISVSSGGGYRSMPEIFLSPSDRLALGWDAAIPADEEELQRRLRHKRSPARVSFLERAMVWPATYLRDSPDEARMLQLWLRCKVSRRKFRDEVEQRKIARATAYRQRDRALTMISVGLDRDGVPLWK